MMLQASAPCLELVSAIVAHVGPLQTWELQTGGWRLQIVERLVLPLATGQTLPSPFFDCARPKCPLDLERGGV